MSLPLRVDPGEKILYFVGISSYNRNPEPTKNKVLKYSTPKPRSIGSWRWPQKVPVVGYGVPVHVAWRKKIGRAFLPVSPAGRTHSHQIS